MAKIEGMTVEVLRQGESYTNDKLTVRVALEEGDDPWAVEAETRDAAVKAIERHWQQRRDREMAEAHARRAEQLGRRDERAKRMMAAHEADAVEGPCINCPEKWDLGCDGCPAKAMNERAPSGFTADSGGPCDGCGESTCDGCEDCPV